MAEIEPITFKVTPDIAAKLTEAGTAKGKSRHLVAKEIVLNALNKGPKASDDAVASALFELREEVHQLSDYMVEQNEQPVRRAKKRRPSKQMRQLLRTIASLKSDFGTMNGRHSSATDFGSVTDLLSRQARAIEVLEARLNEIAAAAERGNVVPHIAAFANKAHKHQLELGEQTTHLLNQVQHEYCEIISSHMQIRHDIARTLKVMLGYVENISEAHADRLVHNLLAPSGA